MTSPLDANWKNVAAAAGYKTPNSAKEMWRLFRVKYKIDAAIEQAKKAAADAAAAGVADGPAAAAGASPAKGAVANGAGVTPVKRGRGRPPKNAAATPGTSAAIKMAKLAVDDGKTPETPSKGTKRGAASSSWGDNVDDDTPAKKKKSASASASKLRLTKKNVAAAAAQAEGDDAERDTLDVAMERIATAIDGMRAARTEADGEDAAAAEEGAGAGAGESGAGKPDIGEV